jgi:hypothetical protein
MCGFRVQGLGTRRPRRKCVGVKTAVATPGSFGGVTLTHSLPSFFPIPPSLSIPLFLSLFLPLPPPLPLSLSTCHEWVLGIGLGVAQRSTSTAATRQLCTRIEAELSRFIASSDYSVKVPHKTHVAC